MKGIKCPKCGTKMADVGVCNSEPLELKFVCPKCESIFIKRL